MPRPKKITSIADHVVDLSAVNLGELQAVNGIGLYTIAIPKHQHERVQKIADFKRISVEKLIDLTLRELIAGRISI